MKRFLSVMLVLMLVAVMFVPSAQAESKDAAYKKVSAIVSTANATIKALVRTAQCTPCDDALMMLAATEAVAYSAKVQAAYYGYKLGCSYTTYYVDGHKVSIDPLYVINPPRPPQ